MSNEPSFLMPHPIELLIILPFLLFGIAFFAWWLIMLIEALRIPSQQWDSAGHNQVIYVVAMFLIGIVGTFLYVLIPRKELRRRFKV